MSGITAYNRSGPKDIIAVQQIGVDSKYHNLRGGAKFATGEKVSLVPEDSIESYGDFEPNMYEVAGWMRNQDVTFHDLWRYDRVNGFCYNFEQF